MKHLCSLVVIIIALCGNAYAQEKIETKSKEVSYSDIRKLIDEGVVERGKVTNDGWWVTVYTKEGDRYFSPVTPQTPIADHLYEAGVPVLIEHYKEEPQEEEDKLPTWLSLLINLLPLLIFLLFVGGVFLFSRKGANNYYSRAEKMNAEFLERLEKALMERKETNG
jgi:ATP-dependent Zn protease